MRIFFAPFLGVSEFLFPALLVYFSTLRLPLLGMLFLEPSFPICFTRRYCVRVLGSPNCVAIKDFLGVFIVLLLYAVAILVTMTYILGSLLALLALFLCLCLIYPRLVSASYPSRTPGSSVSALLRADIASAMSAKVPRCLCLPARTM